MNGRWCIIVSLTIMVVNAAVLGWFAHTVYAGRMDALRKAQWGDVAWLACQVLAGAIPDAEITDEDCERAKLRARKAADTKAAPGPVPAEREERS